MHGPPCKHLFAGGAVLSRGHRCQPSAPACNMSSSALATILREPITLEWWHISQKQGHAIHASICRVAWSQHTHARPLGC